MIVRRGAADLLQNLQEQFAGDPQTLVLMDRRVADRRWGERRFPENLVPLSDRGFFVTRPKPSEIDWRRGGQRSAGQA